jgi:hypothetical protein
MAKKRMLVIFALLLIVAIAVVLTGAVFTLQKAKLFFVAYEAESESTVYIDAPQEYNTLNADSLIKDFKGKSVFFLSTKSLKKSIHKQYPYLQVVGTQRVFPSTVEIFVTKRIAVANVSVNGYYYLVDSDLFVLERSIAPYVGYILFDNSMSECLQETQAVGEQLVFKSKTHLKQPICDTLDALWAHYYDYVEMPDLVSTLSFGVYKDCDSIKLHTKTGARIWIVNPESDLSNKVNGALSVYISNDDGDQTGDIDIYSYDPDTNTVTSGD